MYCIEAYCATHFLVDSSKVARRVLHRRQCFEKAFIIRRSVCHHYSVAPSRICTTRRKFNKYTNFFSDVIEVLCYLPCCYSGGHYHRGRMPRETQSKCNAEHECDLDGGTAVYQAGTQVTQTMWIIFFSFFFSFSPSFLPSFFPFIGCTNRVWLHTFAAFMIQGVAGGIPSCCSPCNHFFSFPSPPLFVFFFSSFFFFFRLRMQSCTQSVALLAPTTQ